MYLVFAIHTNQCIIDKPVVKQISWRIKIKKEWKYITKKGMKVYYWERNESILQRKEWKYITKRGMKVYYQERNKSILLTKKWKYITRKGMKVYY